MAEYNEDAYKLARHAYIEFSCPFERALLSRCVNCSRSRKLNLAEREAIACGDPAAPTATVRLILPDGSVKADAALGTGPVDAVYRAINRIVGIENELTEFHVKSVTEGIDAQGEVTIRVEGKGRSYTGRGADTDIIVASAKAYMNALNRMLSVEETAPGAQVKA